MDIVKFEDRFIVGYTARYASDEDLREGHSFEGYSLEVFSTLEKAREYLQEYFPNELVREV